MDNVTDDMFLYGWGRTRHIRDPNDQRPDRALCGFHGSDLSWRARGDSQRVVARFRNLPICKTCRRKAGKRGQPSET